jgi:steroid delta-isomerase-like uncharacterized protein
MTSRPQSSAEQTATEPGPEETAIAYVTMWNERDYSSIPGLVSETFRMYDPAAPEAGVPGPKGEVHGRTGLRQFMEWVTTAFPDFEITVLDVLTGEATAMYEVRLTMTHDGPLGSVPPTGRRVDVRGVSILRLDDGLVDEHRFYTDMTDVADQLGLTFPQVLGQLPRLLVGKARSNR